VDSHLGKDTGIYLRSSPPATQLPLIAIGDESVISPALLHKPGSSGIPNGLSLLLALLDSLFENALLGLEVEALLAAVVVEPLLDVSLGLLLVDVVSGGGQVHVEVLQVEGDVALALGIVSLESVSKFTAQP